MDSVFAFTTKDAAVIVSEMTVNSDITVLVNKKDKIREVLGRDLMIVTGDAGDVNAHTDYLLASLNLQYFQNNKKAPTTAACANWIRHGVWESVRDHPIQVKICYAGVDQDGPKLYSIDNYGALMCPKYIAQNYSMYLLLAVMDKYYKEEMTKEEMVEFAKKCIAVMSRRFLLQQHRFLMKIATKNGIEAVEIDHQPELLKNE